MAKKEDLEVKKNAALAVMNFEEDAGKGIEGADKDSFAIPFLLMLQKGSPQVDEESGAHIAGAKPGMMINTVTNELFKAVEIIPVAFKRVVLLWEDRDKGGGGFKGHVEPSTMEDMVAKGLLKRNEKNKLVDKDGVIYADTRQHYILHKDSSGVWVQAVLAMSSTQIKRSKKWLAQIAAFQMKTKEGRPFNPPSFSRYFIATSEREENAKGVWWSWVITPPEDAVLRDEDTYAKAKGFNNLITAGKVVVDHSKSGGEEAVAADEKAF